jgi:hypothetical protein
MIKHEPEEGVTPVNRLNCCVKWLWLEKPTCKAMSAIAKSVLGILAAHGRAVNFESRWSLLSLRKHPGLHKFHIEACPLDLIHLYAKNSHSAHTKYYVGTASERRGVVRLVLLQLYSSSTFL